MTPRRPHIGAVADHDSGTITATAQLNSVAAAVDVVGDLRAFLLLRDLVRHGPQTVASLHARNPAVGLSGIDALLYALVGSGMVEWTDDPRGSSFRLTELGRTVEPVIAALERFGSPLVRTRPVTPDMLAQAVHDAASACHDELLALEDVCIVALEISGRRMGVVVAPGILRADAAVEADTVLSCTQDVFLELLEGNHRLVDAVSRGDVEVDGPFGPAELVVHLLRRGSRH